jgi:tetratricopeptide (TPR) repeat protein
MTAMERWWRSPILSCRSCSKSAGGHRRRVIVENQAITPTEKLLVSASSDVSAHRPCFDLALKRYNRGVRIRFLIIFMALLTTLSQAQNTSDKAASDKAAARSREAEESSSHDTRIDISPPKGDAKNHPASKDAVADLDVPENIDVSGVQEFHPWNPMKALKDIEVGDFYFKRKNYKAALDRYKEALYYKDNDAIASFRLAVCQEKLGDKAEAKKFYEQYLKILPEGPFAKDAHASLERLAKAH